MRYGIVGTGWSAGRFTQVIKDIAGSEVIYFVPNPGSAVHHEAHYGEPQDWKTVLNSPSIDAIIVCSPPLTHLGYARDVIHSKKHLIIEKSVGLNSVAIEELHRMASQAGVVVMVPYHLRLNPLLEAAKKIIKKGLLGDIVHTYHRMYISRPRQSSWLASQAASGGVIRETLVHGIHLNAWIFGVPDEVYATGHRSASGVIDAATVIMRFQNHSAVLEGCWLSDRLVPFGRFDVVGTHGSVIFDRGLFHRRFYKLTVTLNRNPLATERQYYDLCNLPC